MVKTVKVLNNITYDGILPCSGIGCVSLDIFHSGDQWFGNRGEGEMQGFDNLMGFPGQSVIALWSIIRHMSKHICCM